MLLSSCVPYYYEIKAILVLWLLSPYTKDSWTLYKKFVPLLHQHEQENDKIIATAKELRLHNTLNLCTKFAKYPCVNVVCWLKRLKIVHVNVVIIFCVQTCILP